LQDEETVNTLVVKNELGETEIRFRLGLGDQPRAGTYISFKNHLAFSTKSNSNTMG
jgi:hypothetical protein